MGSELQDPVIVVVHQENLPIAAVIAAVVLVAALLLLIVCIVRCRSTRLRRWLLLASAEGVVALFAVTVLVANLQQA